MRPRVAGRPSRSRRLLAVAVGLAAGTALAGAPAAADLLAPPPPTVDVVPSPWPSPSTDEVGATAWVLVEGATGQPLAGHRADERRPVASTIKVLTAISVLQRADPDDEITVGNEVLVGGASIGLRPGDTRTVRELVEAIVVRSGNDAAEALAVHVGGGMEAFVDLMEQDARALGLEPRELTSPSGLDDGNRLSASELATLARAALADPRLRPILALTSIDLPGQGTVDNRNELLGSYPGATGVKTGFTLAAGNSLVASARRGDRELVAVVLDAGDDPARFEQAARLLDLGFGSFTPVEVGAEVTMAVAGGSRTFTAVPHALTVPVGSTLERRAVVPPRVPDGPLPVVVEVDGEALVELAATTTDTGPDAPSDVPPGGGAGRLGAALVDGAYASLRATAASGGLR